MNQPLFDEGFRRLLAGQLSEAERLLEMTALSAGEGVDAFYLWSAAAYLAGNEARAADILAQLRTRLTGSTTVSNSFFRLLGLVIEAVGEERGDRLHRFFQRHRMLPWQLVGRLGAEMNWEAVEPWNFAKETTRFFPKSQAEFSNLRHIIDSYVLPGYVPPAPMFDATSSVLMMGSCFAQNLRNYLAERGLQSDWMFVPPGLNNTFALRNFIDWCVHGERSTDAYWYDQHEQGGALKWEPAIEHQAYRKVLSTMSGLVLTVGLAEVWYDAHGGGVFWRGVPQSIYDPGRHKCRVSSVAENRENLSYIVRSLHALRPNLPIIITLSPVPLKATFDAPSIFTADCVSKSILRVAIHELLEEGHPNLHYWPSFEMVRWLGSHVPGPMFGEDGNTRHVNRDAVRLIIEAFIRHYYSDVQLVVTAG
jgi:hypothetical protein